MIDLKEERAFGELRRLGRKLHIPVPEAFWALEVFDKNGRLIRKYHTRSHSWTRNYYNYLFCAVAAKNGSDALFGAGKLNVKDTAGVVQNGNAGITTNTGVNLDLVSDSDGVIVRSAITSRGIVVGSGANVENFENFELQTPIAEGTGAGELNAVESESHVISENGLILIDTQVRFFNNNSGGNVSINEVALVNGIYCGGGGRYNTMMTRDKLGATVTVPDTGQLKVTYTIQLTYPA